jgi:hypothetical protein
MLKNYLRNIVSQNAPANFIMPICLYAILIVSHNSTSLLEVFSHNMCVLLLLIYSGGLWCGHCHKDGPRIKLNEILDAVAVAFGIHNELLYVTCEPLIHC